jgi:hypothetical protein
MNKHLDMCYIVFCTCDSPTPQEASRTQPHSQNTFTSTQPAMHNIKLNEYKYINYLVQTYTVSGNFRKTLKPSVI